MRNVKSCAVIVHRSQDIWEGCRTALGLAVENFSGVFIVLGSPLEMNDELAENLEWLDDLEWRIYSDVASDPENHVIKMDEDQLVEVVRGTDLVIPFGNPR